METILSKFVILLMSISYIFCSSPTEEELQGGKRLIKTSESSPAQWMTPEEISMMVLVDPPEFDCPWKLNKHFIDITSDPGFSLKDAPKPLTAAIPRSPRFQSVVKGLISSIDGSFLHEIVRHLSEDYHTRYYESDGGEASEQWLTEQVNLVLSDHLGRSFVAEVSHSWRQKSVIARLHGEDPTVSSERVILGAHIDSATFEDFLGPHNNSSAPGADDDASGSAILMETLRILVISNVVLRRTIEFHWYSGSEAGLLGSIDLARSYRNAGVEVAAMLQFDRAGYQAPNTSHIGIFTDDVNPQLAGFARALTNEYLEFRWRNNICGYGCSDHVAWTEKGYPAAFISDASYPYSDIGCNHHFTSNDTIDLVSFNQVKEMVKLAVGLVVEIGEPLNVN